MVRRGPSSAGGERMRRLFCGVLPGVLLLVGSAQAARLQGERSPETTGAVARAAVGGLERTVVGDNIAHYRYDVRVGPGRFDTIQIHRVVKERRPYQPVQTADAAFLVPGAPQYFERIFMPRSISSVPSWDRSFAVFLAKNDIDVWGVTFGWNLAPPETTDFAFMKGWGVAKDSWHTEIALSLARGIRGMSGLGFGALHLLGFSYGVWVAYSVAAEETQWPRDLRNIKGLIPVDSSFKYPVGSPSQQAACSDLRDDRARLDAGEYQVDRRFFMRHGDLALSSPDAVSPSSGALTNYQAALSLGKGFFVGSVLDESGKPRSLLYTEPRLWIDLLRATPPYTSRQQDFDTSAVSC